MPSAYKAIVRRISLLLLCFAPWVAPLPGATLERLSLNDLIQKSTDIVRGTLIGSYADFRGTVIYTHFKLQVTDRWKGASQSSVEVLVPGGAARGFRQDVTGAPKLVTGQDYLLFLWTSKSGATYLTGWGQGVLNLTKDGTGNLVASRPAIDETILDPSTWLVVKDEGLQMSYADITAQIAATL